LTTTSSEPVIAETKPEPDVGKDDAIKTELDSSVSNVAEKDTRIKVENEDGSTALVDEAAIEKDTKEVLVVVPGGGTDKVIIKTEDKVEEKPIKEEKMEEDVVVAVHVSNKSECDKEVVKDESSSKKKEKKKKKSKKEKKREKKARKEAKKKRKQEKMWLENAKKQKKEENQEENQETEPATQAAQAVVGEPPMLMPVPAEEDLIYQSNALRYDCPPNRDFSDFKNVEPSYQLEDTNVDEMSPWKTRRCVGPILDFVKEQKAKGLDLDVPYKGQEVIKAPDPPKKATPEFRRRRGGRRRGRGRGRGRGGPPGRLEQGNTQDLYDSLLSDFAKNKNEIDYF